MTHCQLMTRCTVAASRCSNGGIMFDVSNRHDPVDGGDTTLWLTALWTGHCADCDYEIWVCDVGCAETFRSFPEAMRNNNRDCAPPHWRLAAHGRGVAGE